MVADIILNIYGTQSMSVVVQYTYDHNQVVYKLFLFNAPPPPVRLRKSRALLLKLESRISFYLFEFHKITLYCSIDVNLC